MLNIFQIYGEKEEGSIYSLWESNINTNPFSRDTFIYKSNSFQDIKQYYEDNYGTLYNKHLYLHIGLSEKGIEEYINPNKEVIKEIENTYKLYAD